MNRLSLEKRARILACLVEGNSIRGTVRLTGASKNTVVKLLSEVGAMCIWYMDEKFRDLTSTRVEVDEVWTYCWRKEYTVPAERKGEIGVGDVYVWTALDPDSKLLFSYLAGRRDSQHANAFMEDVASRLKGRVQICADGFAPYRDAIELAFAGNVDFGQVVKAFGNEPPGRRKRSSTACAAIARNTVTGNPQQISTSLVERQNLTMRQHMRRMMRRTTGFSRKFWNLEAALALHFAYYNLCRVHSSIRVTPAMEAGVETRIWELEDLVRLTL